MSKLVSRRLAPLFGSALLLFALFALPAPCRAQGKIQIFGGYSYLRASVEVGQVPPLNPLPCPPNCGTPSISQKANLSGWEVSGEYGLFPLLGVVADFAGDYGTLDGASTHVHSYLFGPQLELPLPGHISPFVHALFGGASESQNGFSGSGLYSLGSDQSFASAYGGGLDLHLVPFVSLRVIQLDYFRTKLHGATQNQLRLAAGLVLHF